MCMPPPKIPVTSHSLAAICECIDNEVAAISVSENNNLISKDSKVNDSLSWDILLKYHLKL